MLSINTVCFEGICRVYRNTVVTHIRSVLRREYPDDWESRIATPFSKEWDDIRNSAEIRRNTGELDGELTDDADLLGVNHFYNLFEVYFDCLFPEMQPVSEADRKQKKQAILGWSRTVKNMRDPVIGHPADADVTSEDAFMMLDSARRILESIDYTAAQSLAKLRDSVKNQTKSLGSEVIENQRQLEASTLPPRESVALNFVGREKELDELNHWLRDPYSRVWLLAGDGGKGKTAIAYEFAIETLQKPPPDLEIVIWLSAKARRFVKGQSIDIENPNFEDLNSAL